MTYKQLLDRIIPSVSILLNISGVTYMGSCVYSKEFFDYLVVGITIVDNKLVISLFKA